MAPEWQFLHYSSTHRVVLKILPFPFSLLWLNLGQSEQELHKKHRLPYANLSRVAACYHPFILASLRQYPLLSSGDHSHVYHQTSINLYGSFVLCWTCIWVLSSKAKVLDLVLQCSCMLFPEYSEAQVRVSEWSMGYWHVRSLHKESRIKVALCRWNIHISVFPT